MTEPLDSDHPFLLPEEHWAVVEAEVKALEKAEAEKKEEK